MQPKTHWTRGLLVILLAGNLTAVLAGEQQIKDSEVLEREKRQVEKREIEGPGNQRTVERRLVYIESDVSIHRGTRPEENCFFIEEHDHLHCFTGEMTPVVRSVGTGDNQSYLRYETRQDYYRVQPDPVIGPWPVILNRPLDKSHRGQYQYPDYGDGYDHGYHRHHGAHRNRH